MKPFFTYYGGKYRAAPRYPSPAHPSIIEPFAGSAGYSVRYPAHDVTLIDLDEKVIGTWQYLIRTPSSEIARLPLLDADDAVDDFSIPQEAKWLIGWWLNKGTSSPRPRPSVRMRGNTRPNSHWGTAIRERIASQIDSIRHWNAVHGDYRDAPMCRATWFVDPPYQKAGKHYIRSTVDYTELAEWCRILPGQAIVCENEGADWLPFSHFMDAKSMKGKSREALWQNAPSQLGLAL